LLNVTVNNNISSEIILYNTVNGRIFQKLFTANVSIDTRELPAGIYFYEIRTGNEGSSRGKLIKQ